MVKAGGEPVRAVGAGEKGLESVNRAGKILVAGVSSALGFLSFLYLVNLLPSGAEPSGQAGVDYWLIFVVDRLVSFLAGAMISYLFYFLVWECAVESLLAWWQRRP